MANFLVPVGATGVRIHTAPGLDLTRRFSVIEFEETPSGAPMEGAQAKEGIERTLALGAVLTVSDSVGCSQQLLEMTVEYALHRVTFGKPIAAYQAIKHKCADMLLWLESSRVAARYAAEALDTPNRAYAVASQRASPARRARGLPARAFRSTGASDSPGRRSSPVPPADQGR